eukprot:gene36232-48789_t
MAHDLIGELYGSGADIVAIPVSRLGPGFLTLSTRVAGEVIQKFVNYGFRVAFIGDVSEEVAGSDALRDFIRESNRGRHVGFLGDMAALEFRRGPPRLAPDQSAQGRGFGIADAARDLIDRQTGGLQQALGRLNPDPLRKPDRRQSADRGQPARKSAWGQVHRVRQFVHAEVARDVLADPELRLSDASVLSGQKGHGHVRRLGAPLIQQQISGAGFGQAGTGELGDQGQHQIHLGHGGAGRGQGNGGRQARRAAADHH